jgi:hypothetical protein
MDWTDGAVNHLLVKGPPREKVNLVAPTWRRSIALDSRGSFQMRA